MLIERVAAVSPELFAALADLIPQLSRRIALPAQDELSALLKSPDTALLVARLPEEDNAIVGMLTVIVYRVPSGTRAVVEDVVVSEMRRRRGIAKSLMQEAIKFAREAGAGNLSLTSNANRLEANLLYQRLGFHKRETNAYFLDLAADG
ncbi:MAG: GNAT family N-acetyltransferase [Anaerolineales bacterium]|nr:GNAT family N-acetyltransferase [Anaerolineales bacterium]MCL4260585.1 GNAT family N-acetyltransferase [Anaerolineales bacterium]